MDLSELNRFYSKFKYGENIFHTLMPFRVREILFVSNFYDAFIFEQEGLLSEQIFKEYHMLNLTSFPRIISVPTAEEALDHLAKKKYDLVITMMRTGKITPFELSKRAKKMHPGIPVLLLLNLRSDLSIVENSRSAEQHVDEIFLWDGDSRIFLAMIKYVEDLKNVEHDTLRGLVRVILLVEDSIFYYSKYLPLLYAEIMDQTQRLISEELNDMQKILRRRNRPKVLLANNYEAAEEIIEKYKDYLLCVISDISYPRNGKMDSEAGLHLINHLREQGYERSILLQSSDKKYESKAKKLNVSFLYKDSDSLLDDLSTFIHDYMGFGDFVFRDKNGKEIDRASTLNELESKFKKIKDESLIYHGKRHEFSAWLIARGEVQVAKKVRRILVEDFENTEDLRNFLLEVFKEVHESKHKGRIINFEAQSLGDSHEILRLSEGSLGGKGRGIAFLNALLTTMEIENKFSEAKVKIPRTAFIGTDEFDLIIRENELKHMLLHKDLDDDKTKKLFLERDLSKALKAKLAAYLKHVKTPIAVRSSGLLEDSISEPFAGVYQTYMLPNSLSSVAARQSQLECAIKLVFASVFLQDARNYIKRVHANLESEKMAVIIQEIAGDFYHGRYYPHFSGIARAHNFYPTSYAKATDGMAFLAVGLGQWIADGGQAYQFCPEHPGMQVLQPETLVNSSQSEFYALNMENKDFDLLAGEMSTLAKFSLHDAEQDGTLDHLASVWDEGEMRLRDGLNSPGTMVVTFANILKYDVFPLSEILKAILSIGSKAFGTPVEIEFAVDLSKNEIHNKTPTFHLLQIRPMPIYWEDISLVPENIDKTMLWLYTEQGMGNGTISTIRDIVFVDPQKFNVLETVAIKQEIQEINQQMIDEGREYILIGPGRWGSRDRFLGVPVNWVDINNARVIVETGMENFAVSPSQGTHFFHNLVSMDVGYFYVPHKSGKDFVEWGWLKSQKARHKGNYIVHIRGNDPFVVQRFGKHGIATIAK